MIACAGLTSAETAHAVHDNGFDSHVTRTCNEPAQELEGIE
ncbi:hypothetical protein [Nocardia sp. NPDC004711]